MQSVSAYWGNAHVYTKESLTFAQLTLTILLSVILSIHIHMDPSKKRSPQKNETQQTNTRRNKLVCSQEPQRSALSRSNRVRDSTWGQRRSKPETNKSLLSKPPCSCSLQNFSSGILSFKPWLTHRKRPTL